VITAKTLDRKQATTNVSNARSGGKRCDEFVELSGINKSNIKNLPREIQTQMDNFLGNGKGVVIVRKV
jgi:hypothetical protein